MNATKLLHMTEASGYSAAESMPDKPPTIRKVNWPLKEKIVISGISGKYPESDNVDQFKQNLYSKVDMVTEDERRHPFG